MQRLAIAAVTSLVLALAVAQPAAGETEAFVAYGEGDTVCTIWVSKQLSEYAGSQSAAIASGRTECNVPVEQSVVAWMDASESNEAAEAGECSGFTTSCESWTWVTGGPVWPQPAQTRVHLTAPLGQGWVGVPTNCSGVGTDNLTCTFQAYAATPWFYTF
jgi:hypothetical protein